MTCFFSSPWRMIFFAVVTVTAHSAYAGTGAKPASFSQTTLTAVSDLENVSLTPINRSALLNEDVALATRAAGVVEKRLRVAINRNVNITPQANGQWETLADGSRLWRIRVIGPNATDLRFGFSRFHLPAVGTLHVIDVTGNTYEGPYTNADTSADGQLWLPMLAGSEAVIEVHLPADTDTASAELTLSSVGMGYRNVTERNGPGLFAITGSGACNIDVVCPLGNSYRNEIRSVARMLFASGGSSYFCTGSLVMNTARNFKPFFLTADHCISTQPEASSITFVWNYQSPTCGAIAGGSTSQSQTGGGTLRAHRADVDFSLVEITQTPPLAYNVFYAGWDASASIPTGSIGIHHPSGSVKAITETNHALTTMNNCIGTGGVATHWRTGQPYSQGTTEGGSSGSAIFSPAASSPGKLIIGTLSGGDAACSGTVPNSGFDCYGKLSVAWNGASSAVRLKDWLDPAATGATTQTGANPDVIFQNGLDN